MGGELQAKGGASDLVQETFLEAQRDFAQFAGESEAELLAWLRRILHHNLANFTRQYRATEMRQLNREVPLEAVAGDGPSARSLSAAVASPSCHAMRKELAQELEGALARLPEHYRQAIVLRHQEALSFEQMAAQMDRSPEAVRKLWARAVQLLQRELEARHGG
jgi:RNA polymerase sigma-70 factor (ECF subfamily)